MEVCLDKIKEDIIRAIKLAQENKKVVFINTQNIRIVDLVCLPFKLHTEWIKDLPMLKLNSTFFFMPITSSERRLLNQTSCDITSVYNIRKEERLKRHLEKTDLPSDIKWADWEDLFHEKKINGTIPLDSILSVDFITSEGINRGNRSIVGRHIRGTENRISIFTLKKIEDINQHNSTDINIINFHSIFSKKKRNLLAKFVNIHANQASLVFISGPWDLEFFNGIKGNYLSIDLGIEPPIPDIKVCSVNVAEVQYYRSFQEALVDCNERAEFKAILSQIKNAWWALEHQLISKDLPREYLTWVNEFKKYKQREPVLANYLNLASKLLDEKCNDKKASLERLETVLSVLDNHLEMPKPYRTLVITGAYDEAEQLRAQICSRWSSNISELKEIGLEIISIDVEAPDDIDCLIISGFYGYRVFKYIVGDHLQKIIWVLDPIEAAVVYSILIKFVKLMSEFNFRFGKPRLLSIIESLKRYSSVGLAQTQREEVNIFWEQDTLKNESYIRIGDDAGDRIDIVLDNGVTINIGSERMLDVISHADFSLSRKKAHELEPGDEVFIPNGDFQSSLSSWVISQVDNGRYAREAKMRQIWLTQIKEAYNKKNINANQIAKKMNELNVSITSTAVRKWLAGAEEDVKAHTPFKKEQFQLLNKILDLNLNPDSEQVFFDAIRRWGIGHRREGRKLTRAICDAAIGNLTRATLEKIAQEWSLEVRDLVGAAQRATVEHIEKREVS